MSLNIGENQHEDQAPAESISGKVKYFALCGPGVLAILQLGQHL